MIFKMLRYGAGIVLGVSLLMPSFAFAQETLSASDVRAATDLARSKGYCKTEKNARSADCLRQSTNCDAAKWQGYISANVVFINGTNPQQKEGGQKLPDGVYTFLAKSPDGRASIPTLNEAVCKCVCGESSSEPSCKGKERGTRFQLGDALTTREECTALCSKASSEIAPICAGALPTFSGAAPGTAGGQASLDAAMQAGELLMTCFSQSECSEQKGTWETYSACSGGKGRCIAPEPEVQLNTRIGGVSSIRGFSNYVVTVFRYMLSIVVFLTTVMFVWGAFRYLVGSGVGGVSRGKAIMKDSVIGMILMLCSVLILRTINPATVRLNQVKVYMINTRAFVQSQFCKDLPQGSKLADAGVMPTLKPKASIGTDAKAYSEAPKTTECGHEYYIKDSSSDATCTGLACKLPNEVCVSCASGEPEACQRQKSNRKVCDKQMFAGSVDYQDSRYPEQVYLVGVCGYAQTDPYGGGAQDIVNSNITLAAEVDLSKIRKKVGSTATDEDVAGNAMYSFKIDAAAIQTAVGACPQGFRGFLLGVQYNDGAIAADDMALLTKQNCAGGDVVFDGYANGSITDKADLATAFLCGLRKSPPKFLDSSGTYWKREELEAAVAGRQAISCNFNLSNKNAPADPGEKDPFCPVAAGKQKLVESTAACESGIKAGNICDSAGGGQACSLDGKICKCTPMAAAGTAVTSMWKCE